MQSNKLFHRRLLPNLKSAKFVKPKVLGIDLLWHIVVPLIFLVTIFLFFPNRGKFELDSDEGINLMKAMLVEEGYPLYEEIWSDQPPLFTYMLAGVIRIFGNKVGAARLLVLGLSGALLWAYFQFLRMVWGNLHALVGVVILFFLPSYMILSMSVMVGLPSITFAMLSLLALTAWHKQHRYLWLTISAVMLSVSILTKIFTGFLAPIMVGGIVISEYTRDRERKNWRVWIAPAFYWGAVFTILTAGLGLLLIGPNNVMQLLNTHISASEVKIFQSEGYTLTSRLKTSLPTLYLALAGAIYSLVSRRWLSLYPVAWMITAYLLLLNHIPIWYHHRPLVTIPAAMLSAGVVEGILYILKLVSWRSLSFLQQPLRFAVLAGLLLLFLSYQELEPLEHLSSTPSLQRNDLRIGWRKELLLEEMVNHAPETQWVVTDLPMFAFRARLLVPPNLAVFSMKRFLTGNLTEQDVIDIIQEYQPEQILLGRHKYPLVEQFIEENYYQSLSKGDEIILYLRNDL